MKSLKELVEEARAGWGDCDPGLLLAKRQAQLRYDERLARKSRLERSGASVSITNSDYRAIADDSLSERTKALDAVSQFYEAIRTGSESFRYLVLLGEPDIGKSVACSWLAAQRDGAIYVKADKFSRTFAAGYDSAQETFDRWLRALLLIVDDVGTEKNVEAAEGAIYRGVDERQNVGHTLLTSNLARGLFEKRVGDRVIRRIQHQGKIVVLKDNGLRVKR